MQILGQWWSTAAILSEFISALLLTLIVALVTLFFGKSTKKHIKYGLLPFLYGYAGLVAIFIGFGFGMMVKSGEESSLMSMPFTFIKAIYFKKFNLVPAALSFQLIGSVVGIVIYVGITKLLPKRYDVKDGLIIPGKVTLKFGAKETVAQIIFILILVFTTSADYGFGIKGNIYFGVFVSGLCIAIEFAIFSKYFFFFLSPQLIIANLLAGHYYKVTKLESWVNLAFCTALQLSAVMLVAYPEYALRTK